MVQILPQNDSWAQFGRDLAGGATHGYMQRADQNALQKAIHDLGENPSAQDLVKAITGVKTYHPESKQDLIKNYLGAENLNIAREKAVAAQQGKEALLQQKLAHLDKIFNPQQASSPAEVVEQEIPEPKTKGETPQQFDPANISDEDILKVTAIDPALGRGLQQQKEAAQKKAQDLVETEHKRFVEDRKYHGEYTKESDKKANELRDSLVKKEAALDQARSAIESGDIGRFSTAHLADLLGLDTFQTVRGTELTTASKENLLSNMTRVSARGQNKWFEQRLNSIFAQLGKTKEANLAAQEVIEGEEAMDKAYLREYDRVAEEDERMFGFTRKDAEKRARRNVEHINDVIFKRTAYRIEELEQQEKGMKELKKQVGKKVPKGKPLTLAMATLYQDKYGDKALEEAEKDGYQIPTLEEFRAFNQTPREFREGL